MTKMMLELEVRVRSVSWPIMFFHRYVEAPFMPIKGMTMLLGDVMYSVRNVRWHDNDPEVIYVQLKCRDMLAFRRDAHEGSEHSLAVQEELCGQGWTSGSGYSARYTIRRAWATSAANRR